MLSDVHIINRDNQTVYDIFYGKKTYHTQESVPDGIGSDIFMCNKYHDKITLSYYELNLLKGVVRVGDNIKSARSI